MGRHESRSRREKHPLRCVLDHEARTGRPLPPLAERLRQNDLTFGRNGGFQFFGRSHNQPPSRKTEVRYASNAIDARAPATAVIAVSRTAARASLNPFLALAARLRLPQLMGSPTWRINVGNLTL